jgi:hypothetical protein
MINIRKSGERGSASLGWLDSRFSFSFDQYYDPDHMGFRTLRVINDDHIAGGGGFPMHPHRDMEIITYMLEGQIAHRDSLGNQEVLRAGEVQRMTAGAGIVHSEFNPSPTESTHLLQIWLRPNQRGLQPGYDQKRFEGRENALKLIVSGDGRADSLRMNQDADLYASILSPGASVSHELAGGRFAWLQVARGDVTLNGITLSTGDGASIAAETRLDIQAQSQAELLLFDLD